MDEIKHILIIRFSSLGDILLTTPVVGGLRKAHPKAKIFYVTKQAFANVLDGNSDIDEIISLEKNENIFQFAKRVNQNGPYDLLVDLHSSIRSLLLRFMIDSVNSVYFLKPYWKRWNLIFFKRNLFESAKKIPEIHFNLLKPYGVKKLTRVKMPVLSPSVKILNQIKNPYVVIAPGARWGTKRWPTNYFANLIEKISLEKVDIILIGGKEEEQIGEQIILELKASINVINLIGKLSLKESAYVLKKTILLISNDSGAIHMASGFKIPIVVLFLSTVPEFGFAPFTEKAIMMSVDVPCKPCDHKGLKKCPQKHFNCAYQLTPRIVAPVVAKEIRTLLKQEKSFSRSKSEL